MDLLAGNLALSDPEIERRRLDVEPDREIFDGEKHSLS
jgi:hypothetical protein